MLTLAMSIMNTLISAMLRQATHVVINTLHVTHDTLARNTQHVFNNLNSFTTHPHSNNNPNNDPNSPKNLELNERDDDDKKKIEILKEHNEEIYLEQLGLLNCKIKDYSTIHSCYLPIIISGGDVRSSASAGSAGVIAWSGLKSNKHALHLGAGPLVLGHIYIYIYVCL